MTFDFLPRTLQSWQRPEPMCISNCNCYTASVSPVCGSNGVTYLSACFAGCTKPVSGAAGGCEAAMTLHWRCDSRTAAGSLLTECHSLPSFIVSRTWAAVRVSPATARRLWLCQESVPVQAARRPSSPSCVLSVCAAWLEPWPRLPQSSSLSGK